jgi:hypothetical protein
MVRTVHRDKNNLNTIDFYDKSQNILRVIFKFFNYAVVSVSGNKNAHPPAIST